MIRPVLWKSLLVGGILLAGCSGTGTPGAGSGTATGGSTPGGTGTGGAATGTGGSTAGTGGSVGSAETDGIMCPLPTAPLITNFTYVVGDAGATATDTVHFGDSTTLGGSERRGNPMLRT